METLIWQVTILSYYESYWYSFTGCFKSHNCRSFFEQLHFNLHVILCKVCKLYKHNQIEKGNETIQHMLELCYGYPRS